MKISNFLHLKYYDMWGIVRVKSEGVKFPKFDTWKEYFE